MFWGYIYLFSLAFMYLTNNLCAQVSLNFAANPNNIPKPVQPNVHVGLMVKSTQADPEKIKLALVQSCKDFIHTHCAEKSNLDNNLEVLECVQNVKQANTIIDKQCQHFLWTYKLNLTVDEKFDSTARVVCQNLMTQHPICHVQRGSQGQLLYCLMEYSDNTTDENCRSFLKKMETIVFSDYRLIYKFTDSCKNDIQSLQCGRISKEFEAPHSQGETIECLSKQSERLQPTCRHAILRIAELQGDDFHLDRPLYFACREDREKFCSHTQSGEGKIYRCLMRHKLDREMSKECRDKLFQREKLVVQDYKVNRGLAKTCREDIKIYHCRDETSERREFRLAQILLCLENVIHKGYPVAGECQAEMKDHRKTLMENYRLTPDLATNCEQDILDFCKHLEGGGKTIHCLMAHARPSRRNNKRISDKCRREVENLLKEVDIGESWKVDPVFQESCEPVVSSLCSSIQPGEGRVLSCLMDHTDSVQMTEVCREVLIQIQYFVARDFKLDFMVYKACRDDAVNHCNAKREWHDNPSKMDPERGPIVLPCLYRYAYHPDQNVRLSRSCLYELKRVMRQRAISVDLQPEIEEPCLADLSKFCSDNVEKGTEVSCLQSKLKDLSPPCRSAISNFTEEEAEHLELNYPLYKACQPLLKFFCDDLRSRDVDQGDLLQCLIDHKNSPEMKNVQKCRVALEHFQLISLKDYRFSFKFKESCKKDTLTFCRTVKTKSAVVSCLSGIVTNDTLNNQPIRISRDCRSQLRAELFQRSENIRLDPVLDDACRNDQKKFCVDVQPGESQMTECLKDHQRELSPECHRLIFNREKEGMLDNAIDYALVTTCKQAIKLHCLEVDMAQVLFCLKTHRSDPSVENSCRKLIIKRLVEQSLDYRLNVQLKTACKQDIPKFCPHIIDKEKQDELFEGKVIACLKKEYRKSRLSQSCDVEVMNIMRDSGKDIRLDPILLRACSDEIHDKCREETNVEECLKMKFQDKSISNDLCRKEIARLIHEGQADIHSDPLLYRVCVQDIKHYCSDVEAGHGRQLSCLLAVAESTNGALTLDCKTTLAKRMEMFEYAAQVAPAETVEELIRQVANSPARNYFVVLAMGMFGIIFFGGLFCGRIYKRVPKSVKNK